MAAAFLHFALICGQPKYTPVTEGIVEQFCGVHILSVGRTASSKLYLLWCIAVQDQTTARTNGVAEGLELAYSCSRSHKLHKNSNYEIKRLLPVPTFPVADMSGNLDTRFCSECVRPLHCRGREVKAGNRKTLSCQPNAVSPFAISNT